MANCHGREALREVEVQTLGLIFQVLTSGQLAELLKGLREQATGEGGLARKLVEAGAATTANRSGTRSTPRSRGADVGPYRRNLDLRGVGGVVERSTRACIRPGQPRPRAEAGERQEHRSGTRFMQPFGAAMDK